MKTNTVTRIFTLIAVLTFAFNAQSATIVVTDPGSDFKVTYDDSEAGAFGTLVLVNNTIFFVPDDFTAESANGAGQAFISETLNLQLDATTQGFTFDSFFLYEEGDYIVDGVGTEVSASGEMRVRDAFFPFNSALSEFDFFASGDGGTGTQQWSGSTSIDGSSGWAPGTTSVLLTLQNVLTADSMSSGELAFIQKKFEGVQISVNEVPLPAGVWLFSSALLGFIGLRRQ
ncbi:MAG: hypothetical protein HKN70_07725 [Gammaproteobacteria bacterium]|nr:hypothetical protein [Gammaproteobacteria bacterium]